MRPRGKSGSVPVTGGGMDGVAVRVVSVCAKTGPATIMMALTASSQAPAFGLISAPCDAGPSPRFGAPAPRAGPRSSGRTLFDPGKRNVTAECLHGYV